MKLISRRVVVVSLLCTGLAGTALLIRPGFDAFARTGTPDLLSDIERFVGRNGRKYQATSEWHRLDPSRDGQEAKIRRQNCEVDEDRYQAIERGLLLPLRKAWMAKQTNALSALAVPGGFGSGKKLSGRIDGIEQLTWKPEGERPVAGAFEKYLAEFASIRDVSLETVLVRVDPAWRAPDLTYRRAEITVRFDARGTGKDGRTRQDRGTFRLMAAENSGAWIPESLTVAEAETLVANRGPSFVDATAALGLANVPVQRRTEAIRRGGYALAMHRNATGVLTMLVGARDHATVWEQAPGGNFRRVSSPAIEQTLIKAAAFASFSNDGDTNLLISRFSPEDNGDSDVLFFRKGPKDKDFSLVPNPIRNRWRSAYAMPLAVGDFNKDGLLDFYVGFPGSRDFSASIGGLASSGLATQGIFMNEGKGVFADKTKPLLASDFSSPQNLFPHSVVSADLNGDGWDDLIVMDDRGNLSPVYINNGDGSFRQVASEMGLTNRALGMSIAVGDVDNDGLQDIAMTNVDFVAAGRMNASCNANWGQNYQNSMSGRGLRLFKNLGDGHFADVTSRAGLTWAGEATAGIEFVDYDSDGRLDLVVSNGLWSSEEKDGANDLSSLFVQFVANGGQSYKLRDFVASSARSDFMTVLQEYRGDVQTSVLPAAYRRSLGHPSLGGFQRKRLFRNLGEGRFLELGYFEGADLIADGYAVGLADLSRSGNLDLVFRHADPGVDEYRFPSVQVLRNTRKGNNLVLKLTGKASNGSNIDAIGARVVVKAGGLTMTKLLLANNGPVQSERVLHFGLGGRTAADSVTVHWPSGKTKVLRNLAKGYHQLTE